MLRGIRNLAFAVVFLLPLASSAAERRTQVFDLGNAGRIHLQVPKNWQGRIVQPSADLPPTMEFTPATGPAFSMLVTPLGSVGQTASPQDLGRVKAVVEKSAEQISAQSVERELPLKELKGPSATGYYFSSTDPAPKPGEFKYLTQGGVLLGGLFVSFTALSNDGPQGVASELLQAMAGATYESSGSAAVKVTERNGDFLVSQQGSALKLRIPKGRLRLKTLEARKAAEKPQYFYFEEAGGSLVVSGWFEQKMQYPGLVDLWLVSCPSDSCTKSFDLGDDRISCRGPNERLGLWIVVGDKRLDIADEMFDAMEGAPTDRPLGDEIEPDLDLVEPRGIGRRVMDMKAWADRQPAAHLMVLVGAVVVDHQVHVQVRRDVGLDLGEKPQELLVPMMGCAPGQHAA